jgi:hypothetical protein
LPRRILSKIYNANMHELIQARENRRRDPKKKLQSRFCPSWRRRRWSTFPPATLVSCSLGGVRTMGSHRWESSGSLFLGFFIVLFEVVRRWRYFKVRTRSSSYPHARCAWHRSGEGGGVSFTTEFTVSSWCGCCWSGPFD